MYFGPRRGLFLGRGFDLNTRFSAAPVGLRPLADQGALPCATKSTSERNRFRDQGTARHRPGKLPLGRRSPPRRRLWPIGRALGSSGTWRKWTKAPYLQPWFAPQYSISWLLTAYTHGHGARKRHLIVTYSNHSVERLGLSPPDLISL